MSWVRRLVMTYLLNRDADSQTLHDQQDEKARRAERETKELIRDYKELDLVVKASRKART